jgi:hypothetical protein
MERPGLRVLTALAAVAVVAAGCGSVAGDPDECPKTFSEGSVTDGIDLPEPAWLPAGFPLPDGLNIRHVNDANDSGTRVVSGFVPRGDLPAIVTAFWSDVHGGGYEMLLVADGFVPRGHSAFTALDAHSGVVIKVDATPEELAVRDADGECPMTAGILVGMRFTEMDAEEARVRYAGSSLTIGTATAAIGGQEFAAAGECLILDGAHSFGSLDDIVIGLQVGLDGFGFASVDVVDEAVFALDVTPVSGVDRIFGVTADGFFAEGMFIDAFGDLGVVAGRVDATCSP